MATWHRAGSYPHSDIMSTRSTRPKPGSFGRDIHRLLQAAEEGHRADVLTYSSGHLGPRSLVLNQPHKESKQPFWASSNNRKESPRPFTPRIKPIKIGKNNIKEYLAEVTADFTSLTLEQTSTSDLTNNSPFDAVPGENASLNKSLPCMRKPLPKIQPRKVHKKSENTSKLKEKPSGSDTSSKEQMIVWTNAAEIHEKKLEIELQKLSSQRWPSRDRLSVFSDVFGDVCKSSTVFGHILWEIKEEGKNEYDLYANHMMSNLENMPSQQSLQRPGTAPTPNLEEAARELHLLEQEARDALEENKRLKAELQTFLETTCPEDKRTDDRESAEGRDTAVHSKRRQVSQLWTEIQELEEELQNKLVSTDITTAIELHVRSLKAETMKLMVSNNQLDITNKELEDKINTILLQEKISKAIKQKLWSKIRPNL